jgi:hypothetical protein
LIYFINDFLKGKVDSNFEDALIKLHNEEKKSSFMLKKKRNREGGYQRKRFIGNWIINPRNK